MTFFVLTTEKKLMKYTPFKDCENEKNAYKELSAGPGQNTGMGSLSLLQGIFPGSLALQADSLPAEPQGKPKNIGVGSLSLL